MSRMVLICSFAALLATSSTGSANAAPDNWYKDSLARAAVGIDPGSRTFNKCVTDLHHSLWAERNLEDS